MPKNAKEASEHVAYEWNYVLENKCESQLKRLLSSLDAKKCYIPCSSAYVINSYGMWFQRYWVKRSMT
ncbi:unnamed protein product [Lathyrus oleraceus]